MRYLPIGVKKTLTQFGQVNINKSHDFSEGMNGFQISPRLEEMMVYADQMDCYEKCNEVLHQFLDINVSVAQVYRVTNTYGKEAEKKVNASRTLEPVKKTEVLYDKRMVPCCKPVMMAGKK